MCVCVCVCVLTHPGERISPHFIRRCVSMPAQAVTYRSAVGLSATQLATASAQLRRRCLW